MASERRIREGPLARAFSRDNVDAKSFFNGRFLFIFLHVRLRYIFKNQKKAGLQELGPRFTLKLRSLQRGTFDSKFGEYEWIHKVCQKMMIRSI